MSDLEKEKLREQMLAFDAQRMVFRELLKMALASEEVTLSDDIRRDITEALSRSPTEELARGREYARKLRSVKD